MAQWSVSLSAREEFALRDAEWVEQAREEAADALDCYWREWEAAQRFRRNLSRNRERRWPSRDGRAA